MAPTIVTFITLLATFHQLGLSQHQTSASSLLLVEPEEVYHVGRKHPAQIVCQARDAEDIVFRCGGQQIQPSSVETDDPSEWTELDILSQGFHIRASIEVTRSDVRHFHKQQKGLGLKHHPYWCECGAIDANGEETTSRRAIVRISHDIASKEVVKSRSPRQSSGDDSGVPPHADFVRVPKAQYIVTADKNISMDCWTIDLSSITFECNTQRVDMKYISSSGKMKLQNSSILTRAKLEMPYNVAKGLASDRPFGCQCSGWYFIKANDGTNRGTWTTKTTSDNIGKVVFAYMEDEFSVQPSDVVVQIGTDGKIKCKAPRSNPKAYIYWFKDDKVINTRSDRHSISSTGDLIIRNVQHVDAGTYHCQAKNQAFEKNSQSASLTVSETPVATTTPEPKKEEVVGFPSDIPDVTTFLQEPDKETTLAEEGNVNFFCAAIRMTSMAVNCGGQRLKKDEHYTVKEIESPSESGQAVKLVLANVTVTSEMIKNSRRPNAFFCQCTAWQLKNNKWVDTRSGRGQFILSSGSAPPTDSTPRIYIEERFQREPSSKSVNLGVQERLICRPPRGNPQPKIYWLKDGERVEADTYIVLRNYELILRQAREEDGGMYTCIAENQANRRASTPAQVTVIVPTTKPPKTEPTSRPTPVVDPFTFETPVTGEIPIGLDVEFFGAPDNMTHYIIGEKPLNLTCTAVNTNRVFFNCNEKDILETMDTSLSHVKKEGDRNVTWTTNVYTFTREMLSAHKGKTEFTCACVTLTEISDEFVIRLAYLKSKFVKSPAPTRAVKGKRLVLECIPPIGVPEPEVFWTKRTQVTDMRKPVEMSNRVRVQTPGNLVIDYFQDEDEGEYACVASSISGKYYSMEATVAYNLIIDPQPSVVDPTEGTDGTGVITDPDQMREPYIIQKLPQYSYVTEDESAQLVCEAGNAKSIRVLCDDQTLPDSQVRIRGNVKGTRSIITAEFEVTLSQVLGDNGDGKLLSCVCETVSDVTKHETRKTSVYIYKAYLKDNFMVQPQSRSVLEGAYASLDCQAPDGLPPPKIEWYRKDGKDVTGKNIGTGTLLFRSFQPDDSADYYCIASNIVGQRQSDSARLQITREDKMTPPTKDTDTTSMPDEETTAEEGGDPEPTTHGIKEEEMTGMGKKKDRMESGVEDGETTKPDMDSDPTTESNAEVDVSEGSTVMDKGGEPKVEPEGEATAEPEGKVTAEPEGEVIVELDDKSMSEDKVVSEKDSAEENIDDVNVSEGTAVTNPEAEVPVKEGNEESVTGEGSNEGDKDPVTDGDSTHGTPVTEIIEKDEHDTNMAEPKPEEKEENGNTGGVISNQDGSSSASNGKFCLARMNECNSMNPRSFDGCGNTEMFKMCVNNFETDCMMDEQPSPTFDLLIMARNDVDSRCLMYETCFNEIIYCQQTFVDFNNQAAFNVQDVCSYKSDYQTCIKRVMTTTECTNTVYMADAEEGYASLNQIDAWLGQYCDAFVDQSSALAGCSEMANCKLVAKLREDAENTTFWCRTITGLLSCTNSAADQCHLDELRDTLATLRNQKDEMGCDDYMTDPEPEIDNEPEPTGEPTGEGEQNGDGDPTNEPDQNNSEGQEGGAAATKQGDNPKDGSQTVGVSFLLTIALQLLVSAILSVR